MNEKNETKSQSESLQQNIPERRQKLQNIPVLLLFGICLITALVFSFYSFPNCSPWFSYYGIDSWGNICSSLYQYANVVPGVRGSGQSMFGKDKVWALNFLTKSKSCVENQTLTAENLVKICVSSCPAVHNEENVFDNCMRILQENDYGGEEFAYAHSKCQLLNESHSRCSAGGARNNSE